jgi:hypothetical protein
MHTGSRRNLRFSGIYIRGWIAFNNEPAANGKNLVLFHYNRSHSPPIDNTNKQSRLI